MKRWLVYVGLIILLLVGGFAYLGSNSITSTGITSYYAAADEFTVTNETTYADDNVRINIVRVADDVAEYVVRVDSLNEETTVLYSYTKLRNHSTLQPGGSIFDEIQKGQIDMVQIHVYDNSGVILKKPVVGLVFGDLSNVPQYDSVEAAREALKTQ